MTTAEKISECFRDDGQCCKKGGMTLQQACLGERPIITTEAKGTDNEKNRYEFRDGSSIVTDGLAWDLGLPGGCFCWEGEGHSEECTSEPLRLQPCS